MKTLKNLIVLIALLIGVSSCDAQMVPAIGQVICPRVTAPSSAQIKNGLLYNWWALTSAKKISSSDVWVPVTATDYVNIQTALSGNGGRLKNTSLLYWNSPNTGAENYYSFDARGSSYRLATGSFGILKTSAQYITEDVYNTNFAKTFILVNTSAASSLQFGYNKKCGSSIRLKRTTPSISSGQNGTYVGNNGQVYITGLVNGIEMILSNLAETKYRDGSTIPEVTDNTVWANLTTDGCCAFNNDWANVFQ